jgi:hypothetical protein
MAAGSALLLSGCAGGEDQSTWSEYYQVVRQSFSSMWGNNGISRDQAAAIPYASLGYRLNQGQETLLILATDTSGEELWTSASHIVIVTQDGRVTRTVGLPHDLGRVAAARSAGLPSPALALSGPHTITLSEDFADTGAYGVIVTCGLEREGPETITILGHAIATTRVDENCDCPQLKWRFRNSYWLDSDRFVWRSSQHIHPDGDVLDVEIFRPPG